MPRLVFPDDQLVYALQGNLFTGKPGTKIYMYTDALATTLADIQDMTNATLVGSYVTVDSNSLIPLFQGPNDGRDTLYAKPEGGGTAQALYARTDDRLDTLNTQVAANGAALAGSYRQFLYGGIL